MINKIRDDNGVTQVSSLAVLKAFSTHFFNASQTIDVQEDCMNNMLECNIRPIPPEINSTLIEPITEDEIRKADRTTLQVFVTYLTGALYVHPL